MRKLTVNEKLLERAQSHMNKKDKDISPKATPTANEGVTQKRGGIVAKVHTPPPTKRKNTLMGVTIKDPKAVFKCKKTMVEPNSSAQKPWVSSTIDGKGEPILDDRRAISNPVVVEKFLWAIILPTDSDVVINMSREDCQCKLNCTHYHVSLILLL